MLRRVAPEASKVELADVAGQGLGAKLITAMGAELAAARAGVKRRRRQVLEDLQKRKPGWPQSATQAAERSVRQDFDALLPLVP